LRILFVHNKYLQSAGGEDTTVEAEVRLLTEKGHAVDVLYFNNAGFGGSLLSKIKAGLKTVYNPDSKKQLTTVIRSFKPDIVHVHNFYFQASPAIFDAAAVCKVPIVFTVHNFRLICVNALLLRNNQVCEACVHSFFAWKGVVHKCYHHSAVDSAMVALISASHKLKNTWTKKVDRYITPSAFLRNKLLDSSLKLTDPNKIAVKRNFLPDPGVGPFSEREGYYLFVGRLSEEKGVDFLLRSFASLPGERILVVGDGPQRESLEKSYGIYANISFLGKKERPEVLRLMKSCRALLFPSIWYEGLPVTIIEAFATGTPVIASRLGAMEEMIIHGNNGLLFEKESAEAITDAIHKMNELIVIKDDSLYRNARSVFMSTYSPEVCYDEVMKIYTAEIENKQKLS
jgi:glycosyltransferase involved in cell wall biosynthesis